MGVQSTENPSQAEEEHQEKEFNTVNNKNHNINTGKKGNIHS